MNDTSPAQPLPAFEGRPVNGVQIKVSGSAPLDEIQGVALGIDDRVQLLSIYTVTGVHHAVDPKTGDLVRVQTLKPVEMHLFPFDDQDPNDDGIIRALLPGAVVTP